MVAVADVSDKPDGFTTVTVFDVAETTLNVPFGSTKLLLFRLFVKPVILILSFVRGVYDHEPELSVYVVLLPDAFAAVMLTEVATAVPGFVAPLLPLPPLVERTTWKLAPS
jgi:hypothetical protein